MLKEDLLELFIGLAAFVLSIITMAIIGIFLVVGGFWGLKIIKFLVHFLTAGGLT